MQAGEAAVLVRNLHEVFNERDAERRLAVIRELYTEGAIFYEPDAEFTGYDAINQQVTTVLGMLPAGAVFQAAGAPAANHNLARLVWTLAVEGGPVIASGMDVAILEEGRIAALYLFMDAPPA